MIHIHWLTIERKSWHSEYFCENHPMVVWFGLVTVWKWFYTHRHTDTADLLWTWCLGCHIHIQIQNIFMAYNGNKLCLWQGLSHRSIFWDCQDYLIYKTWIGMNPGWLLSYEMGNDSNLTAETGNNSVAKAVVAFKWSPLATATVAHPWTYFTLCALSV